jgi:hypothetical protein
MEAVLYLPAVARKYDVRSQGADRDEQFTVSVLKEDLLDSPELLAHLDNVYFVTLTAAEGVSIKVPQLGKREFFLFRLASTYRRFFLASPFWLAGIIVLLNYIGGPEIRRVMEFMAPWSSSPFQR